MLTKEQIAEIERLRTDLATERKIRDTWFAEAERLRVDLATERLLREHAEGEIRRVAAEREAQGVEFENLRAEVERLRREAVTARAAERRACINECLDEIETNDDAAERSGAHACLRRIEARISFDGPPVPPRDEADR